MNKKLSIGMIETNGYIPIINAIDTVLKYSNVEILNKNKIGSGIVTIILVGDISSVKDAISHTKQVIESMNYKFNSNVIANPHHSLWNIL